MMMHERQRFLTKIEEVSDIAKEIAKNKNVKAVYLFGSQVSGKVHGLSDIDLCVITDGRDGKFAYSAGDNVDISIFDMLPVPIQFRVLKEGKPLVIKDQDFIYNLKIKTIQEYLDIKPLINKYLFERFGCTI